MTVNEAATVGVLLYLLPLFMLLVVRSRRDREIWEIALDMPFAVALDMLGVLLLARVMPLETAVVLSRPLWLAGGVAYLVHRVRAGRAPEWPSAIGRRELLLVAVAAAVAVYLSLQLSRPCLNADRNWHIPLVASLRGQRIPFSNVYEPGNTLGYHYAGNILAAMIQTLSFRIVHSSFALSLAHDLMFGLTGASLALMLRWWGFRSSTAAVLGVLSVLLTGPATLLRADGQPSGGYNFVNYLRVSFRPHVSLAGLLFAGFIGALAVRLRDRRKPVPAVRTAAVLIAVTALLVLTDEASAGILGLALGAAWVVEPNVIHPKRLTGIAVFFGLMLALVVPSLLFPASLAPGAPHHLISLVPWRSPGYRNPSLPLTIENGWWMLLHDLLPMLGVWIAGALAWLRTKTRENTAIFTFVSALMITSVFTLTRIDVDGLALESHRFVTAAMFCCPILGLTWLSRTTVVSRSAQAGTLTASILIVSLGLAATSTLEWLRSVAPKQCDKPQLFSTNATFLQTNCEKEFATTFGLAPDPEYVAKPIAFEYIGCRPTFLSGPPPGEHWKVKVGWPQFGYDALKELHQDMLHHDQLLPVICPGGNAGFDPICVYARKNGTCTSIGTRAMRCDISGEQRTLLLMRQPMRQPN